MNRRNQNLRQFQANLEADSPSRRASVLEVVAVLSLVLGLVSYAIYQEFFQAIAPPIAATPSPSPRSTRSPSLAPTASAPAPIVPSSPNAPTATDATPPQDPAASQDIYQRAPKTGVYYPQSPLLNASQREIVSSNGRFCIKITNGSPAPARGQPQILVSSLSLRSDGIYVDATSEKLTFDRSYTELTDSKGTWQLLEGKGDRAGVNADCLAATTPFAREVPGK